MVEHLLGRARLVLDEIEAGAKARPMAVKHDGARLFVSARGRALDRGDHRVVDGIALVGPVEPDHGRLVSQLIGQELGGRHRDPVARCASPFARNSDAVAAQSRECMPQIHVPGQIAPTSREWSSRLQRGRAVTRSRALGRISRPRATLAAAKTYPQRSHAARKKLDRRREHDIIICRPREMEVAFLSLMRIMVGLLFLEHGLSKYFGFPSAAPGAMTTLAYIQGVIEIVGGVLLTSACLYAAGGLHPVRRHGCRLFHAAHAARLLPGGQWRRSGRSLLLRLLLYLLRRRRPLERRSHGPRAGIAETQAVAARRSQVPGIKPRGQRSCKAGPSVGLWMMSIGVSVWNPSALG